MLLGGVNLGGRHDDQLSKAHRAGTNDRVEDFAAGVVENNVMYGAQLLVVAAVETCAAHVVHVAGEAIITQLSVVSHKTPRELASFFFFKSDARTERCAAC